MKGTNEMDSGVICGTDMNDMNASDTREWPD